MKNAPKSITSEMMKSSIPSNCASTREETFAAGGPWCSSWSAWPAAIEADSIRRSSSLTTCSTGLPVDACDAPDQVAAQPARARLGEGRDHDVVRRVELERVLDRRERVRVGDLADRVEPGVLELLQRVREPLVRRRPSPSPLPPACGRDHDEAVRLLARPCA